MAPDTRNSKKENENLELHASNLNVKICEVLSSESFSLTLSRIIEESVEKANKQVLDELNLIKQQNEKLIVEVTELKNKISECQQTNVKTNLSTYANKAKLKVIKANSAINEAHISDNSDVPVLNIAPSANQTPEKSVASKVDALTVVNMKQTQARNYRNAVSPASTSKEDKEDGFEVVSYRRNKKESIVGTGEIDECIEFTAADSNVWIYVGRVNLGVTSENVIKYIKAKTAEDTLICAEELSTNEVNKCFKVGINSKYKDNVYDPSFWPKGTIIRRFNFKPFRDRSRKHQATNQQQWVRAENSGRHNKQ